MTVREIAIARRDRPLAADVHAQGVDTERVADDGQQLPTVPDTVRPLQLQGAVEMPVDALRVVASPAQHFEVRIPRRDLPHVLRPVELALRSSAFECSRTVTTPTRLLG